MTETAPKFTAPTPMLSAFDMGWPCPMPILPDSNISGRRDNRLDYNRPMKEQWHPTDLKRPDWALDGDKEALDLTRRTHWLYELVTWMDFTNSKRWLKNEAGGTYCDHGVFDLFFQWLMLGREMKEPWIPPLAAAHWWTPAVEKMIREEKLKWWKLPDGSATFGAYPDVPFQVSTKVVRENGATSLARWFRDWGPSFGWVRCKDPESLREVMNMHQLPGVIICEKFPGKGASHVCTALPDDVLKVIRVRGGHIDAPKEGAILSTEAGGRSRTWTQRSWWTGRWLDRGYWFYPYSPEGTCVSVPDALKCTAD